MTTDEKIRELEAKLDKLAEAFLKLASHETGYAGSCKVGGCTCHFYVHGTTRYQCAREDCGHGQYDHL